MTIPKTPAHQTGISSFITFPMFSSIWPRVGSISPGISSATCKLQWVTKVKFFAPWYFHVLFLVKLYCNNNEFKHGVRPTWKCSHSLSDCVSKSLSKSKGSFRLIKLKSESDSNLILPWVLNILSMPTQCSVWIAPSSVPKNYLSIPPSIPVDSLGPAIGTPLFRNVDIKTTNDVHKLCINPG